MAQKKKVKEIFKRADSNGDGKLDLDEFMEHFKAQGVNMSRQEAQLLFKEKDRDQDNFISLEEFAGEATETEKVFALLSTFATFFTFFKVGLESARREQKWGDVPRGVANGLEKVQEIVTGLYHERPFPREVRIILKTVGRCSSILYNMRSCSTFTYKEPTRRLRPRRKPNSEKFSLTTSFAI